MSSLLGKSVILTRVVKCISYFSPITVALYAILAAIVIFYQKKRARLVRMIEKIPGPASLPIIGNTIEINVDHDGTLLKYIKRVGCQRSACICSNNNYISATTKEVTKDVPVISVTIIVKSINSWIGLQYQQIVRVLCVIL